MEELCRRFVLSKQQLALLQDVGISAQEEEPHRSKRIQLALFFSRLGMEKGELRRLLELYRDPMHNREAPLRCLRSQRCCILECLHEQSRRLDEIDNLIRLLKEETAEKGCRANNSRRNCAKERSITPSQAEKRGV